MGFHLRTSFVGLVFLALSRVVLAADGGDFLILMGAPIGFGNNSNLEVSLSSAQVAGGRVTTAGFDGKTLSRKKQLDLPLMTREDFVKAIRTAVSRMKGDTLLIYFNGHAGPTKNDRLRAQIGLSTEYTSKVPAIIASQTTVLSPLTKINYQEIGEILEKEVPKSKKIKLVIDSCFAGCAHALSEKSERICSASSTDYLTPLYVYPEFWTTPYTHDFWDLHRVRPSASLYELHSEGAAGDGKNGPRALLSSESYIDSVLKTGSFYPKREPGWKESVIYGIPRSIYGFGADRFEDHPAPELRTQKQLVSWLDAEAETFEAALRAEYEKAGTLPFAITKLLHFHAGKWKRSRTFLQRALPANQRGLQRERMAELREFQRSMQRANAITRFLRMANPAQKAKYLQLLECEMESL